MSDTGAGGPGSGTEGFTPPGDGYAPPGYALPSYAQPSYAQHDAVPPGYAQHDAVPPGYASPTQDMVPVQQMFPTSFSAAPQYFGPQPPQLYPGGYYGPPMLRPQTSGMAVAGMVTGIGSMLLFWVPLLAPVLAIMGLVFSGMGISQSSRQGWTGTGMAIAGLVCSAITAVIWVLLVIFVVALFV